MTEAPQNLLAHNWMRYNFLIQEQVVLYDPEPTTQQSLTWHYT